MGRASATSERERERERERESVSGTRQFGEEGRIQVVFMKNFVILLIFFILWG
jgi:hypothetical protein